MTEKLSQRNSNIDLLKIVSMMMVVILHARKYGVRIGETQEQTVYLWINLLYSFSIVAVNCFVMITGYFVSMKGMNLKKILKIWAQVEVYSVGIYILMSLIPNTGVTFNIKNLIRYTLPIMTNQYWFVTYYILLMIMSPMLNHIADTLSKGIYQKMIIMLLIVFSIVPTINIFGDKFGTNEGYSLLWFMILYLIAAYFRRYPPKKIPFFSIYIGACISLFLLSEVLVLLAKKVPQIEIFQGKLWGYNSVIVVLASVSLFCKTICMQREYDKKVTAFISKIAGLSFGVYLLHEHGALRGYLWNNIICLKVVRGSKVEFILRFGVAVIGIFLAGIVINWLWTIVEQIVLKARVKGSSQKGFL